MPATSAELAQLLERVGNGDRDAFAEVYAATAMKLFGIVSRILRRRELAEEVLQEVYLRIWERASDFDSARASPITWMATIARNRALDEVRRRELNYVPAGEDVLEFPDPTRLASEQVELSEDLRRLEQCLGELDPERRDAIRLAYLDGFSRNDLAARFSIPVGTVKTWLHRGLKQLKDCLGS